MKILTWDIMLAMVSRKFLQVYQFLSVRIIYSKNLMQLFDPDQFLLWQHFWENSEETFLTRLQKLQHRVARIITGSDYDTLAEPLIEQLGWKTVREL